MEELLGANGQVRRRVFLRVAGEEERTAHVDGIDARLGLRVLPFVDFHAEQTTIESYLNTMPDAIAQAILREVRTNAEGFTADDGASDKLEQQTYGLINDNSTPLGKAKRCVPTGEENLGVFARWKKDQWCFGSNGLFCQHGRGFLAYLTILNFDRKARVRQWIADPQDQAIVGERLYLKVDRQRVVNFEIRVCEQRDRSIIISEEVAGVRAYQRAHRLVHQIECLLLN